ncbi:hypothetical protein HK104_007770, partial [Borealophlyctis nickersoniae]
MFAIVLCASGFYALIAALVPIVPVWAGLVHVFALTAGMGYYGSLAMNTAVGVKSRWGSWGVHLGPLVFATVCTSIGALTIRFEVWPVPLQAVVYIGLYTPIIGTISYFAIPYRDRRLVGVTRFYIKRVFVFCLMPNLFYLASAGFIWAFTVSRLQPTRQVAVLCVYRLVTWTFSAAAKRLANRVTFRRNHE